MATTLQFLRWFRGPATFPRLQAGGVAVVLILAMWWAALARIDNERTEAITQDRLRNSNLALSHQYQASIAIRLIDQLLLTLRRDFMRHGKPANLAAELEALKVDRRFVGVVSFIDTDGHMMSSTSLDPGANFSDREYFRAHASNPSDHLLIGKSILGRITGKWVISLTRRLYHPDGSFAGVVFAALDPSFFAEGYAGTDLGAHSALALVGVDGITRVRRNNGRISYGEDIRSSQLFKELPRSSHGHYVAAAASDGHLRSVSYSLLPDFPLIVVVASSVTDLLAALQTRERITLGTASLGSLAVVLLCILWLKRQADQDLHLRESRHSIKRLQSILDGSPVPKVLSNAQGVITSVNRAFEQAFGYSRDELPNLQAWQSRASPDPGDPSLAPALRAPEVGTQVPMAPAQAHLRCRDGSMRTVLVSTTRIADTPAGEHLAVLYDITERQKMSQALENSLAEKVMLLNEVHHRVKNNLQVISSLLRLESRRAQQSDTRAVLEDMQGRVRSMSLLHESLNRTGTFAGLDLAVYLRELVGQAFRAMGGDADAVRLYLGLQSVTVDLDLAAPCALWVNELISNSLKHAFPNGSRGAIHVDLAPAASDDAGASRWRLSVRDTGIGLPEDFRERSRHSLGIQLATDLSEQIGGPLEIGPGPSFAVTFAIGPAPAA